MTLKVTFPSGLQAEGTVEELAELDKLIHSKPKYGPGPIDRAQRSVACVRAPRPRWTIEESNTLASMLTWSAEDIHQVLTRRTPFAIELYAARKFGRIPRNQDALDFVLSRGWINK